MRKTTLVLLAAMVLMPAAADAAPYLIHVGARQPGVPSVTIEANGTLADGMTVYVGSFWVTGELGEFWAYCVDLDHGIISNRDYIVDPLDVMSNWDLATVNSPADAGGRAAWLYNTYSGGLAGYTPDELRWGLQTAIWNSLYDQDANILAGTFLVQGFDTTYKGVAAANYMLGQLGANVSEAQWLRLQDDPETGFAQDLIGPTVPEPSSLLLLGVGLAAAARRLRKKK